MGAFVPPFFYNFHSAKGDVGRAAEPKSAGAALLWDDKGHVK